MGAISIIVLIHKHLLSVYYVRAVIFRLHREAEKYKTKSLLSHAQKTPKRPMAVFTLGPMSAIENKAFKKLK